MLTQNRHKRTPKIFRAPIYKSHAEKILNILKDNSFQNPPPYEKLVGELSGAYSRRINIQHRIVYQALEDIKTVKVLRMWTHYE